MLVFALSSRYPLCNAMFGLVSVRFYSVPLAGIVLSDAFQRFGGCTTIWHFSLGIEGLSGCAFVASHIWEVLFVSAFSRHGYMVYQKLQSLQFGSCSHRYTLIAALDHILQISQSPAVLPLFLLSLLLLCTGRLGACARSFLHPSTTSGIVLVQPHKSTRTGPVAYSSINIPPLHRDSGSVS